MSKDIDCKIIIERDILKNEVNKWLGNFSKWSFLPFIKVLFTVLIPKFGVVYYHRKSRINRLKGNKIRSNYYYLVNYYRYKIDISPDAIIGENIYFPHPIGIVIGSNVIIGDDNVILSCVTLGTNSAETRVNYKYPKIGSNCYIGTGAKLFGDITIGDNSIIGANAVVTKSFPESTKIAGVPAKAL